MIPPLGDQFSALYGRARLGDQAAREELTHQFTPELERYVSSHCGADVRRLTAPDDICQNALLTFLQRLEGFPDELSEKELLAYLLKIARWQIGDVLKRKQVVQGESAAPVFDPTADTPTKGPATKEDERRQLAELIGRLRESFRTVLTCTVLEGLDIKETAACLGLEEQTVRKRITRARQELQRLLAVRSLANEETDG